jgi:hypothetical protein
VNQAIAARHGLAYTAMPLQAAGVDVESMITINGSADVAAKLRGLLDYVWKGSGLPAGRPTVEHDVSAPDLATLTRVRRIDELTVPLRYGVRSRVFHILPRRPARRIAVYHNGHGEPFGTAATGRGRRQLQILNRFDSCCFAGVCHRGYAPAVTQRVATIGDGHWEVVEDATHDQHTISPYALSVILWDLRAGQDIS